MMKQNKQSGFTLVETLVAILILSMTVGALLTLTANSFFTVRYSRNQIIGDNLAQEALEYVRNMRDTEFMQPGGNWQSFLDKMNVDSNGDPTTYISANAGTHKGCFGSDGCYVDPYTSSGHSFMPCNGDCPFVAYYPSQALYGYGGAEYPFNFPLTGYETTYIRTLKIEESPSNPDQIIVTVTMSWMNGNARRSVSQSIVIANWHV